MNSPDNANGLIADNVYVLLLFQYQFYSNSVLSEQILRGLCADLFEW